MESNLHDFFSECTYFFIRRTGYNLCTGRILEVNTRGRASQKKDAPNSKQEILKWRENI